LVGGDHGKPGDPGGHEEGDELEDDEKDVHNGHGSHRRLPSSTALAVLVIFPPRQPLAAVWIETDSLGPPDQRALSPGTKKTQPTRLKNHTGATVGDARGLMVV
jgi:hypothetical protein